MEFTIKHNEKQYTDSEIREVIDKYNQSKQKNERLHIEKI
jgi:hypothetical protein